MDKNLGSTVYLARLLIAECLFPGGTAVDATTGNGNDTLFLAREVGPAGCVYAFDIQADALKKTALLLEQAGQAGQVTLLQAGHEEMEQLAPGPVNAIMFNLGYRPGGDHSIITRPQATLKALHSALHLLCPGGRVSLVVYTGHPGGREEYEAIEKFAMELDYNNFRVVKLNLLNRSDRAPVVVVIEKCL
ncbi:MAG: methyltransferase domain-containing protein [Peptococcaceae bacterium]|nr:MAG: methyltransferase domain-containing protein [Peptococcaceae bacterium]